MSVTVQTTSNVVQVIVEQIAGPQGPQGTPGEGVPSGGVSEDILVKKSSTDYDTEWRPFLQAHLFAGCKNSTTSTPLTQNTPTKILAPFQFLNGFSRFFSYDSVNQVFRYTGTTKKTFELTGLVSLTSGNNNEVVVYAAINGSINLDSASQNTTNGEGKQEGYPIYGVFEMNPNDSFWLWVENQTSNASVTVEDAVFGVKQVFG